MRMRIVWLLVVVSVGARLLGTSVVPRSTEALVADADHVVIGRVTAVRMFDALGQEIKDPKAKTGPGRGHEIRWELSVDTSGVLFSTHRDFPRETTVRLWSMWHATLGDSRSNEGKTYIFLLKGDERQPVYPAGFYLGLGARKEIEEWVRKKRGASVSEGERVTAGAGESRVWAGPSRGPGL